MGSRGLVADGQENGKRRERVIFPMATYSDNKRSIKKPFKQLGLKWQNLGQEDGKRKGRYAGENVSVFVIFSREHADFTITGDDPAKVETILEAWADYDTLAPEAEEAPTDPRQAELQKELERWKLQEPARRKGEPETFYQKRLDAWKERDPRA